MSEGSGCSLLSAEFWNARTDAVAWSAQGSAEIIRDCNSGLITSHLISRRSLSPAFMLNLVLSKPESPGAIGIAALTSPPRTRPRHGGDSFDRAARGVEEGRVRGFNHLRINPLIGNAWPFSQLISSLSSFIKSY